MNAHDAWQAALGELELSLSKANFTTWFKNTFISKLEENSAIVCVPNTFTKAWLEKKYHQDIVRALRNATSLNIRNITYKVEVRSNTQNSNQQPAPSIQTHSEPASFEQPNYDDKPTKKEDGLNPRYTFNDFVVGKANELAHAASMAVAAKPGSSYNPLFIFGGSGLGKSHLLHAIGGHIKENHPDIQIRYIPCEHFINEFIHAVRSGRAKDFKSTYRTVDVLIVDDIQFISGKESTQEEFFHTFNALHQANKQIILASDRQPKDIQALESRLLTRFEWGMMADVSCPDFETRVAILEAKANIQNISIESEILRYIAGTIQSNVRELEGALNKLLAYHQFKNTRPTLDSVQTLLQSYAPTIPRRKITPKRLLELVAIYFDITLEELLGKSREQRLSHPRQISMYLLRKEAKCSFPAIGKHLGGRDHTTAMHACSKIDENSKKNEALKRDLAELRERLYSAERSG
ncbi:MAG: chromosomal replication initiator protein DnaA [bacterium]|nr:chromosomal replication initiator protein DnaA [bacterium]